MREIHFLCAPRRWKVLPRSVICLAAALYSTVLPQVSQAAREKVGIVVAQSGPAAWWGEQIVRGVQIADEENDSSGAVDFVFEDDQFTAKTAVTAATKLLQQDHVRALLTFGGNSTAAVAEITEKNQLPLIGISAASAFTKDRHYAFRIFMSNESQIDLLSNELDAIPAKKIALVTTTHESMLKFRELFRLRQGPRLSYDEEIAPTDGDMKTIATRARRTEPDAAVFFVNPPNIGTLARALRDQGFTGPFLGGVNMFNPGEIKAAQGALTGARFPGPNRWNTAFAEKYTARFGEPPSSESLYGYDAAVLFIRGIGAGDLLRTFEEAKSWRGMAGDYTLVDHSFEVPAAMWHIGSAGEAVFDRLPE